MLIKAGIPFWRLSGFYFFYFALLGAWLPFWNLYLVDLGYETVAIGYLSAVVLGTKIFAPSVWGYVADICKQRIRLIQLGCLLTLVSISFVVFKPPLWGMLIIVFTYSFFWNAVLPQFEVITVDHLGKYFSHYSKIRLWGSVGFIASVLALGELFSLISIQSLPYVLLLIIACMFLCSLSVKPVQHKQSALPVYNLKQLLKQKSVMAFFIVVALQQFAHGPYYTFYSIYLQELNYSLTHIGFLWSLGVLAEIVIFAYMHKLLPRFSIKTLMVVSLALSALRWLMIGLYADNVAMAIIAQLLHAASFGVCHAVAIEFIRKAFVGRQGVGQALYSGLSFGLGGACGAIFSGYIWQNGALLSFIIAAGASLMAMFIVCFLFRVDNDRH